MIKDAIHKSFRLFGIDIIHFPPREKECPSDFGKEEAEILWAVRPWTKTSAERIYAAIQAARYVSANSIAGAIVECGVWKGGSVAAMALALLQRQDTSRDLYLFDTFEGMSEPTANDVDYAGKRASQVMQEDAGYKCADASLEQVKEVLHGTGYPKEKIHFVRGKVEETIPGAAPERISLLRLDTDWYESTRHELVHLFPRLARAGVLIIDDYGHWKGSRHACDEYFAENRVPILLNRIDYTGRIAVKP
ncbi:MAG: TylF/MycF/NovP-related O-methyltransferase [Candidatus Acidiferrum sp.]